MTGSLGKKICIAIEAEKSDGQRAVDDRCAGSEPIAVAENAVFMRLRFDMWNATTGRFDTKVGVLRPIDYCEPLRKSGSKTLAIGIWQAKARIASNSRLLRRLATQKRQIPAAQTKLTTFSETP